MREYWRKNEYIKGIRLLGMFLRVCCTTFSFQSQVVGILQAYFAYVAIRVSIRPPVVRDDRISLAKMLRLAIAMKINEYPCGCGISLL